MISNEEFEKIIVEILERDISSNKNQKEAIFSNSNESLFIVAGPGSGKTTVMVLKILKFIFVDEINPTEILSTTFTKKAANELYSRVLSWGDKIKEYLIKKNSNDIDALEKISRIDFNQLNIGTIDGVAEELLRVHRDPGTNLPIVIENFVANSAMIHSGLFKDNRYLNNDLQEYLGHYKGQTKVSNPSKMSEDILKLKDRIYFDQIDFDELYKNSVSKGERVALDAIQDYIEDLKSRNIIDFPMLEEEFLKRLNNNKLDIFLDEIKVLLIDEYQDTNLIQENIYFTIAKSALKNNGSITVVGDDDQSLYRFRGATVDLFTDFKKRAKDSLGINIREINLSTNYRSSENIINHCNHFVELDTKYQVARVKEKPKIIASDSKGKTIPVLGLFRQNPEMLSIELSRLIKKLVNNKEVTLKVNKVVNTQKTLTYSQEINEEDITLKLDDEKGSPADISILTYSPKEVNKGNRTFTYFLRRQLEKGKDPLSVFNPRGQVLEEIEYVCVFCGLILECIDPEGSRQKEIKKIPGIAKRNLNKWRVAAREFIKSSPEPHQPISLEDFVKHWQIRQAIGHEAWPETASLMELAYKLITWIEVLQDDVEGIVYLEAITKTITQTGFFNKYSANIHFDKNEKESIEEALWNIFIPIAMGGVEIDENLLETLPEDRINIMSIHQSKGLEFPLVVVDVGSKFDKNEHKTRFERFPKSKKDNETFEDRIRSFSSLGKSKRTNEDKSFDDLTRLYFVAFSRAEDVLLLIGVNKALEGYTKNNKHQDIPNVALGWSRDEEFIGFDEVYMI
ncbi:UvrD-helicase domain-containing protein [Methanobrevibacter sp. DSM 116169]|uniref:UvrD-helicase domain-containing protein n=1 Tax=Methanobrevibacter sp. DSM 116169 TaxID=3242727 RepID=UPI0038FCFDD6